MRYTLTDRAIAILLSVILLLSSASAFAELIEVEHPVDITNIACDSGDDGDRGPDDDNALDGDVKSDGDSDVDGESESAGETEPADELERGGESEPADDDKTPVIADSDPQSPKHSTDSWDLGSSPR